MNHILDAVGKTPLVRLRLESEGRAEIFMKVESRNPGGSVKDRAALAMVQEAIREGKVGPGKPIVEPTSGNTGISLAMIGAVYQIPVLLVMPQSMSVERRKIMKAYGAEVILSPPEEGMEGAVNLAMALVEERGGWMPLQFSNPMNRKAHEEGTAREILEEIPHPDAWVAGVGTGGSLMGVARTLRRENEVMVVAVEPSESAILSGEDPAAHGIQGIGANFIPSLYDESRVDRVVTVKTEEALLMAARLAREEGILAGISSGANVCAALLIAKELGPGKTVVTLLPDTGERYLSTELFHE